MLMPRQTRHLNEKLKNLGFAHGNRLRLYGEIFEVASEPIVVTETVVLVDAIEARSGSLRRLRIPLPILRIASENKKAARNDPL
jgi:hypothetical protein